MPNRDGTGPQGLGPRTGRGWGPCLGMGAGLGFRGGFGRGMGLGRCFFCNRPYSKADRAEALKEYREMLEEELAATKKEEKDLG